MKIEFGNIIAILALIISIINLIIYFVNNKKKIEINLNTYRFTKLPKGYFYIFNVQIVNKSRTPIAIKGINCNGSDNPPIPYLVKENTRKSGKEIISYEKYMTMEFPVNLNSLEGKSGYLEFKSDIELNLEDLMFYRENSSLDAYSMFDFVPGNIVVCINENSKKLLPQIKSKTCYTSS